MRRRAARVILGNVVAAILLRALMLFRVWLAASNDGLLILDRVTLLK